VQDIDERDDEPEPGVPRALQPAEPEQHAPLVLLDNFHRHRESQQDQQHDDDKDKDQRFHSGSPFSVPTASLIPVRSSVRRRDAEYGCLATKVAP
jgi:hypothetical protein